MSNKKHSKGVTRKYPHTPGIDASGIVEESAGDDLKAVERREMP